MVRKRGPTGVAYDAYRLLFLLCCDGMRTCHLLRLRLFCFYFLKSAFRALDGKCYDPRMDGLPIGGVRRYMQQQFCFSLTLQ